jgi:hypothetical protein
MLGPWAALPGGLQMAFVLCVFVGILVLSDGCAFLARVLGKWVRLTVLVRRD